MGGKAWKGRACGFVWLHVCSDVPPPRATSPGDKFQIFPSPPSGRLLLVQGSNSFGVGLAPADAHHVGSRCQRRTAHQQGPQQALAEKSRFCDIQVLSFTTGVLHLAGWCMLPAQNWTEQDSFDMARWIGGGVRGNTLCETPPILETHALDDGRHARGVTLLVAEDQILVERHIGNYVRVVGHMQRPSKVAHHRCWHGKHTSNGTQHADTAQTLRRQKKHLETEIFKLHTKRNPHTTHHPPRTTHVPPARTAENHHNCATT